MHPTTASETCTKRLWKACVGSTDSAEAVRTIVTNPTLHADAVAAADALKAFARPCRKEEAYAILQPLVLIFGAPRKGSPDLEAAWWATFIASVRGNAPEALAWAVSEFIRVNPRSFFPTPGQINELAGRRTEEIFRVAYRVRKAAETPPPRRVETDPQVRQRLAADFKAFAASLRGRAGEPQRSRYGSPQEMAAAVRQGAA